MIFKPYIVKEVTIMLPPEAEYGQIIVDGERITMSFGDVAKVSVHVKRQWLPMKIWQTVEMFKGKRELVAGVDHDYLQPPVSFISKTGGVPVPGVYREDQLDTPSEDR